MDINYIPIGTAIPPLSTSAPSSNMPLQSPRGRSATTNTPVSPRCSTPDVGVRDKPKKNKEKMRIDSNLSNTNKQEHPKPEPKTDARAGISSFNVPLGNQVAKRVLAEAEQSEKALEQIFGELLTQMNIKDDMKAQMRTWDEGKKMTLLRQQRNTVANIKKETKSGFHKYFESCPLKVAILASRGIPNEFLDIYGIIHAKDETYRTTTPWKLPFSCELICRDLMSVLKVQVFRKSTVDQNDPFMGEITFIMDALADDTVHTRWFDLKPMQGRKDPVTGKLQLSLHLMVDKGKLAGSNTERPSAIPDTLPAKPKGVLNLSPLSEDWVLMQNLLANSEAENAIKELVNLLYDNLELDEEQLTKFEHDVHEADAVWMDKIVALGGLAWTLDHIGYLCYKLRSRRSQERDKIKVEKLVSIVRKMLVSKTIIIRLTNIPLALSILLDALDHISPAKQTEVFQMLIACQECKQFSGDLGDALEGLLNSNKRLFSSLLHELEKGKDVKFKEVFLTFMNVALENMRQVSKKIYVRALCVTLGLGEPLLMAVATTYLVPEIARQVEEFLLDLDRDKKDIAVGQNVDKQDFPHKLLRNLRSGYNQ